MKSRAFSLLLLSSLVIVLCFLVVIQTTQAQAPSPFITLQASATKTATGVGTDFLLPGTVSSCMVVAKVTAAATQAGDKLDLFLEKSPNNGTDYETFAHFPQVAGNAAVPIKWAGYLSEHVALTDATAHAIKAHADVAAGTIVQGPFGERWRVAWDIIPVHSTTFTGGGLNDLTAGGTYSGTVPATFTVEIDGTGTPDTFKWRKDAGSWTNTVAITGAAQTLSDGVTVTFAATTGHTLANYWTIAVGDQSFTFSVVAHCKMHR